MVSFYETFAAVRGRNAGFSTPLRFGRNDEVVGIRETSNFVKSVCRYDLVWFLNRRLCWKGMPINPIALTRQLVDIESITYNEGKASVSVRVSPWLGLFGREDDGRTTRSFDRSRS